MILLLDNFDSFTYNLVDYFNQLGIEVKVIRNDQPLSEVMAGSYQGVVLSPGPETPRMAGNLMQVIEHYTNKVPMLGICLGHQAIGQYFGADLVKAGYPMHGKLSKVTVTESALFHGLPPEIEVVRYHSLVLERLPEILKATAYTTAGELMAFENKELKVAGIQFHPEAVLTQYGLQMLKNWASFSNIV